MVLDWLTHHCFEILEAIGIIAGLVFTASSFRADEKAKKIANLIAINRQYGEIWKELYERPKLSRVMEERVNLEKHPVSDEEVIFVNLLILHLNTVHRAIKEGMFVMVEGLQKDIKGFFSLPIPRAVWEKAKAFQNSDFKEFVENSRRKHSQ
jgi:hypothetical protein